MMKKADDDEIFNYTTTISARLFFSADSTSKHNSRACVSSCTKLLKGGALLKMLLVKIFQNITVVVEEQHHPYGLAKYLVKLTP